MDVGWIDGGGRMEVGKGVVTLSMFLAVLGGIKMGHISHIYTGYRVCTCVYIRRSIDGIEYVHVYT